MSVEAIRVPFARASAVAAFSMNMVGQIARMTSAPLMAPPIEALNSVVSVDAMRGITSNCVLAPALIPADRQASAISMSVQGIRQDKQGLAGFDCRLVPYRDMSKFSPTQSSHRTVSLVSNGWRENRQDTSLAARFGPTQRIKYTIGASGRQPVQEPTDNVLPIGSCIARNTNFFLFLRRCFNG